MKNIFNLALTGLIMVLLVACGDEKPTERSVQYMGDIDMYESIPYDGYTENPVFKDGYTSQLPVAGTIARGASVYDYPNSEEGYQMAKDSLRAPFEVSEKSLEKGKVTYKIYCSSCHGDTGDGMGTLVKNEKFLGVPNYKDRDITEGSIYHVIMHGRNLMGSHAGQLTEAERWNVVQYVEHLRADLLK
ncbi:c-type cytochrome [Lutimonas halocynthiae]|uniref:c-type cytochrome n=1 Tax=Lutimonas halocynthiae TaxID=1446477 RepID=UPI0025B5047C|nr:c-type cytochrome [Lutimonas halocynthiae]MDN3642567.1 c-type cytochrome [Lutimonas halocynthiae]